MTSYTPERLAAVKVFHEIKRSLLEKLKRTREFTVSKPDTLNIGEPSVTRSWDAFPLAVVNPKPGVWQSRVFPDTAPNAMRPLRCFEARWLRDGSVDYGALLNARGSASTEEITKPDTFTDWIYFGMFDSSGEAGILAASAYPPNSVFDLILRNLENYPYDTVESERFIWESLLLAAVDEHLVEAPIPGGLVCDVKEGYDSFPVFISKEDAFVHAVKVSFDV